MKNDTKLGGFEIHQEILFNIFEFMDHDKQFLDTVGMVNKDWYYLARHPVIWKSLTISSKKLELVPLKLLKSVSSFTLIDKWNASDLDYFAKYAENVRELDISKMKGWKFLIRRILKKKFPLLKNLEAGTLNLRDYISYISQFYRETNMFYLLN